MAVREPAQSAEESEWHERESARYASEVANDPTIGERMDSIGEAYLNGEMEHERLTD